MQRNLVTCRGVARALRAAFGRDELERLADLFEAGAANLELDADERGSKILARKAELLWSLARAIARELEVRAMNVRIEVLAPEELQQRLVFVPAWIQDVIDRAIKERRPIEYESLPTPFGTYPIRVRVSAQEDGS